MHDLFIVFGSNLRNSEYDHRRLRSHAAVIRCSKMHSSGLGIDGLGIDSDLHACIYADNQKVCLDLYKHLKVITRRMYSV